MQVNVLRSVCANIKLKMVQAVPKQRAIGADDLLPALVFCIVQVPA